MVTRNILFLLRNLINLFIIASLAAGCQNLMKTDGDDFEKDQTIEVPDSTEKDKESEKPETGGTVRAEAPDGSFVNKKAPKLGLIIGGGGILTYASIGVLHELLAQKVAVQGIVGLEWGALVAATFSLNGQAHEAEWQLLKLPHKKFENGGMFSSGTPTKVEAFDEYLHQIFKSKNLEAGQLPFACPYIDTTAGRIRMAQKGRYLDAIKMCWPHPPLFDFGSRMASPLAIREAVGHLRTRGAEVIVYIDVLDKNSIFTADQRKKYPAANLMWAQNKSIMGGLKDLGVDEVVSIPLAASNYLAYESMRTLIRMGHMKSKPWVKTFVKKYDY